MTSEMLELAAEKGIVVKNTTQLHLYPIDTAPMSFAAFIVNSRIRPFLQLHVLAAIEGSVVVGYDSLKVLLPNHEDAPDEELASYGTTILDRTFTTDEIFESILASFGIASIDAINHIDNTNERRNQEGSLPKFPYDSYTHTEGKTYILNDLILTSEAVQVSSVELQKKIRDILSHHHKEFQELLAKQEDTGIPHSHYLELLLKWFPGRVKTRQLPLVSDS